MILQDHGTLAMHAAVKYKHLHVVKYLVRQPDIEVDCLNAFG
jgi:hypothetical protein